MSKKREEGVNFKHAVLKRCPSCGDGAVMSCKEATYKVECTNDRCSHLVTDLSAQKTAYRWNDCDIAPGSAVINRPVPAQGLSPDEKADREKAAKAEKLAEEERARKGVEETKKAKAAADLKEKMEAEQKADEAKAAAAKTSQSGDSADDSAGAGEGDGATE